MSAIETGSHSKENLIPQSKFIDRLNARGKKVGFACVGLDTDPDALNFPEHIKKFGLGFDARIFNSGIIDKVYDIAGAFKINNSVLEGLGAQAFATTNLAIERIREKDSEAIIIGDAKRGDIKDTNKKSAKLAFDILGFDAITLNPFLGASFLNDEGERQLEALAPFLERKDNGMFIVVGSSNDSSGELQDLSIDLTKLTSEYRRRYGDMDELIEITGQESVPLYQIIAFKVARHWNKYGNCGVVMGATHPEKIVAVRKIIGDIPMLIPGVGAQGGDLRKAVRAGINSNRAGILLSSSRDIIDKSSGPDFAKVARAQTLQLKGDIDTAIAA